MFVSPKSSITLHLNSSFMVIILRMLIVIALIYMLERKNPQSFFKAPKKTETLPATKTNRYSFFGFKIQLSAFPFLYKVVNLIPQNERTRISLNAIKFNYPFNQSINHLLSSNKPITDNSYIILQINVVNSLLIEQQMPQAVLKQPIA